MTTFLLFPPALFFSLFLLSVCLNVWDSASGCHIHHLIPWAAFKVSSSLFFSPPLTAAWRDPTSCLGAIGGVGVGQSNSSPSFLFLLIFSSISFAFFPLHLLPSHSTSCPPEKAATLCLFVCKYLKMLMTYLQMCVWYACSPLCVFLTASPTPAAVWHYWDFWVIIWSSWNLYTWQDLMCPPLLK